MKKVLVLALVLLLASTSAWAYHDSKHVKQAPNGEGDLLIFPFYFTANGGWQTKVTVTNTSPVFSVVAKVVVHSHYYSQELLDFLLYLTPNDVWTGTFVSDGTNVYVQSTDDSSVASNGQFASASNPMNALVAQAECITGRNNFATDSRDYGYIEVFEAWYANLALPFYTPVAQTGERTTPPVAKSYLSRVYAAYFSGNAICSNAGVPAVCNPQPPGTTGDRTINVLAGFYELQNSISNGFSAADSAIVFADWDDVAAVTTANANGFVNNFAQNTVGELEAAMAKQSLAMPYVNQGSDFTVHVLTFPTKYTWAGVNRTVGATYCQVTNNAGGPFWVDPNVGNVNIPIITAEYRCLPYQINGYDLSENTSTQIYSGPTSQSSLCEEVNLLVSPNGFGTGLTAAIFNEGWVRYTFPFGVPANPAPVFRYPTPFATRSDVLAGLPPSHTFYGVPVLQTSLLAKIGTKGTASFVKGAAADGHVYGEVLISGTADPNVAAAVGGGLGRLPAHYLDSGVAAAIGPAPVPNVGVLASPNAWATPPGAWPYAPYRWAAPADSALYYALGAAPFHSAVAGVVPAYCLNAGINVCTWLPDYQHSNEIIELGIETLYP